MPQCVRRNDLRRRVAEQVRVAVVVVPPLQLVQVRDEIFGGEMLIRPENDRFSNDRTDSMVFVCTSSRAHSFLEWASWGFDNHVTSMTAEAGPPAHRITH